uniref:Uncharacterized protein n=1 Tax=Otus sunia TaxID=257818 RepID=A0A8C8ASJ1_9STRI
FNHANNSQLCPDTPACSYFLFFLSPLILPPACYVQCTPPTLSITSSFLLGCEVDASMYMFLIQTQRNDKCSVQECNSNDNGMKRAGSQSTGCEVTCKRN